MKKGGYRMSYSKRWHKVLALLTALLVLAACGSEAATTAPATSAPATGGDATAAPAAAAGKLEVFSWWTTGGEAAGLAALTDIFKTTDPNVEFINSAVAGGAGSDAKAVLKTRMLGGDPPDLFQVHMGHELIDTWVVPGQMEPLDDLYAAEGWDKSFPQGVLDIVSYDGHYWSVPANIHRANVLWYNKKVFADNNLTAPTTFAEFFTVAEALQAKGITPLALGDSGSWAAGHLFETVLLGTLGADAYEGLWTGATPWTDPKVTEALENFKKMLAFVNTDHGALSWDQANDLVIQGKAGMTIMGDWVDADNLAKNFTDSGAVASPGTAGVYDALSDTFGIPKGAKNPAAARAFLKLVGSQQGQDAFNPVKGSIPARVDAGQGNYTDYLKSAMADWKTARIVPSVVHGAAAKEGWATAYIDAVAGFVANQDVAKTQAQFQQACVDAGICK